MILLFIVLLILLSILFYFVFIFIKLSKGLSEFAEKKVLFKPIKIICPRFIQDIIKYINRYLLELQAYRAFHLNQLLDERNKFEVLLEIIKDGVILLDDDKKIISFNDKAMNMLKIEKISNDNKLISSITDEKVLSGILNYFNNGADEFEIEGKYIKVSSTSYKIPSVKKTGLAINLRDITFEKKLENMKEEFFQTMAHDLRNPLHIIVGYTELLAAKIDENSIDRKKTDIILQSVKKLDGMIDDILNFNKLKENKMQLRLEKVNPYFLIEKIHKEMQIISSTKRIDIKNNSINLNSELNMDLGLIERVLVNLINNAIKYIQVGGLISLDYDDEKEYVKFIVQDNGPGVEKDKIPLIFEKYGQLDQHKKMGHGIGLAICKMAVELHGGRIWLESDIGKGCKFFFTISKHL